MQEQLYADIFIKTCISYILQTKPAKNMLVSNCCLIYSTEIYGGCASTNMCSI